LKKGMLGNDVKWVQFELKQAGYNLGKDGIDGQFGGKTDTAVRSFQTKYKLEVDGKVGKLTRDKLEEV
jgi:peptidoglycan hydrolase-like protein with peptidoglycan-binding domain